MFDSFVALFLLVTATSNPAAPLPTCAEQKAENSAAYRLQNGGWSHDGYVSAHPLKTCRDA